MDENNNVIAGLSIPNEEIKIIYKENILKWFDAGVKSRDLTKMYDAMLTGQTEDFENELVENTIISNQIEAKPAIITVTNNEVTNTEIEQLLKNAQIKAQNDSQNFDKKGLSAQALLVEVEDDLNKNLKDKLLQTIVANLKTPREITISDRGN